MKNRRKVIILLVCMFFFALAGKNVKAETYAYKGNRDWKWPVSSVTLSSCVGDNRNHKGIDITGTNGVTQIYGGYGNATGYVAGAGYNSTEGNYVHVKVAYQGNYYMVRYMHMSSRSVSTGNAVNASTQLGIVGSTGDSGGPHLHYEILSITAAQYNAGTYTNSWANAVDPLKCEFLELPAGLNAGGATENCCTSKPCCCEKYVAAVKELYSRQQPTSFSSCLDYPKANGDYTDSVYVAGWVKVPSGCTNVTGWCNGSAFNIPLNDRSDVPDGKGFSGYIPLTHLKNGTNTLEIFAYHNTETWNVCSIKINYKDSQSPVISNVKVSEISSQGYTVTCDVTDNAGLSSVQFPTWSHTNGQDDLTWHEGTISGNKVTCRINVSDHKGDVDCTYQTDIYAYDYAGNCTTYINGLFTYIDATLPIISDVRVVDVSENGYTVKCKVTDDHSKIDRVQFPTWFGDNNPFNADWSWKTSSTYSGKLENGEYVFRVNTSNYKNQIGTYHTHIYAWDEYGNCSESYGTETVIKKVHKHDYTFSIKKPATCTESGIMLYTCKDNDDSYEEEIPATGHQHTELRNVSEATCAQEGYTGDTYCKDCGIKLSSGTVIPKTGHTWDAGKIMKAATDTESGIKTYTCTKCNTTRTEEIPATGEHPNIEIRGAKSATCLEEGYTGDTYCKDCGIKLSSGTVIPSTGHGTKITKFVKEATYTQEGYTGDIYCQDCGVLLEEGRVLAKLEQPKQKAIPGEVINDKASNGVYKVLADGRSVVFVKQIVQSKAVKIPDTISINGTVYAVTGISANAFKNNQLLKTAVIGSNVRKIGKQAFYNCKSLKTITIRTSMLTKKNVGAKAFKGTYKKIKVKVPAKQFKTYKKFFKSKGMSTKAIYKK